MSISNPLLLEKYMIDQCYFSCKTNDNGESYVCKKVSTLKKAIQDNASVLPTNCACPAFVQSMRLMRNLQSNKVTIL